MREVSIFKQLGGGIWLNLNTISVVNWLPLQLSILKEIILDAYISEHIIDEDTSVWEHMEWGI
jgi:hypothetical protein